MDGTTTTNGRVAIVSGGSRGIGRATAERLSKDGFSIVVNYAGNQEEADAAVASITDAGGTAIAVRADVADESAVDALFKTAQQEFKGVDVVGHAAGRMPLRALAGPARGAPPGGPRRAAPDQHPGDFRGRSAGRAPAAAWRRDRQLLERR